VVVNAAREHGRRRSDLPAPEELFEQSRNGGPESELDSRVWVALSLLPERQRIALFLRYYADLDYRTIAETLGIAVGTVGVTLNTAQTKLREALEEVPHD
jgi:RNA polymerase sigma factor (sigma-70 family)